MEQYTLYYKYYPDTEKSKENDQSQTKIQTANGIIGNTDLKILINVAHYKI